MGSRKRKRNRQRRAAPLVLVAGIALVAAAGMRDYGRGKLTLDAVREGRVPWQTLVPLGGALLLTIVLAAAVRSLVLACERAEQREREALDSLTLHTRRFQALERDGWDGVMIVDSTALIRWVGVTAARLLQLNPQEVVGASLLGLVHISDLDAFLAALAVPKDSGRAFEFRMRDSNGGMRWFEGVTSNHEEDDAVSGVVLHFRDTTYRRSVEGALRERNDQISAAFDFSPFGSAIVDMDGELSAVNDPLATLVERDADDLVGKRIGSLLSPRDRSAVRAAMRRMMDLEQDSLRREVVLCNGVRASLALTPILGDTQHVRSFFLQIVDYVEALDLDAADDLDDLANDVDDLHGEEDLDEMDEDWDPAASVDDDVDDTESDDLEEDTEIVASQPGWADEIADLEIEIREPDAADAQARGAPDAAHEVVAPALVDEFVEAVGAHEVAAHGATLGEKSPVLRAIVNARRADASRSEHEKIEIADMLAELHDVAGLAEDQEPPEIAAVP